MTTSSPGVRRWINSVNLCCASSIVTVGMVIGSPPGTSQFMIRTRNALFYQTLLTKLLTDGRPPVLAFHEVVPVGGANHVSRAPESGWPLPLQGSPPPPHVIPSPFIAAVIGSA